MAIKQIITHSGQFHCDELTAIALLEVFTNDVYEVTRIPHQATIPDADLVIDIGRILDPANGRFDHHQYEGGKSSAGLIWEHIGLSGDYPDISDIVDLVDQNDVGIRSAKQFELPRVIGSFNNDNIYNDEAQMASFNDALAVLVRYFSSMKEYQDKQTETKTILSALLELDQVHETGIINTPKYLAGWDKFLNGELTPSIRCITWPADENDVHGERKAQVIPIRSGEYGLHGNRFEADDSMTFVHANGFFCVAPNYQTMENYLKA